MAATRSGIVNGVNRIQNPNAANGGAPNVLQIQVLAGTDTLYFTDDLANGANWPIGSTVTITAAVQPAAT